MTSSFTKVFEHFISMNIYDYSSKRVLVTDPVNRRSMSPCSRPCGYSAKSLAYTDQIQRKSLHELADISKSSNMRVFRSTVCSREWQSFTVCSPADFPYPQLKLYHHMRLYLRALLATSIGHRPARAGSPYAHRLEYRYKSNLLSTTYNSTSLMVPRSVEKR